MTHGSGRSLMRIATAALLAAVMLLPQAVDAADAPIFLRRWGSYGTGPGQFTRLYGLAASPSGFLYAVDGERIQKFDRYGNFVTSWTSPSPGAGQFFGLATDAQGYVYATNFLLARLFKFDANGGFVASVDMATTGSVAVDADGNVLVACADKRVLRFDSGLHYLGTWSSTQDPGDSAPMWIAVSPWNEIFITRPGEVVRFAADGTWLQTWGQSGPAPGQFAFPQGVAFDASGRVHVSDRMNGRIQTFTANGVFLFSWGEPAINANCTHNNIGTVCQPYGIVVLDGEVFVASNDGSRIDAFGDSPTAATSASWGAVKVLYR